MIGLSLLYPESDSTLQTWSFKTKATIRIGRSKDNDIILYSAVVSRHHLEISWNGKIWELINLGANGTYFQGEAINIQPLVDGMIIQLATSGPKLQIHFKPEAPEFDQETKTEGKVVNNPL